MTLLKRKQEHKVLQDVKSKVDKAAYYNVKPAALQQQLENIHLNKEKAEAFAQAWTNMGQDFIEKLRQNTFAPKKLEKIGWCLNLEMGQSTQAKMKSPHAILELGVNSEDSEASVSPVRPGICTLEGFQDAGLGKVAWQTGSCPCCKSPLSTPPMLSKGRALGPIQLGTGRRRRAMCG
ncbi:COMM domain-containing protein 10 isoform X3 [Mobula birostris]|uniref:COMM domain-containing protein 10 isoform X3 n=1 Tax=Mobula birostris TaxID=1983395 RepID=UPI003B28B300